MTQETNGPHRVLVVEDSPTQAHHLKLILSSGGFAVEIAYDGEAALSRIEEDGIDIVLSDVMMPGMSGFDLCRRIKSDSRFSVPVVLLTALNKLEDLIEGMRNGADNFLTKPVEPGILVARLRNVLAAAQHEPAASVCDPESGVCFTDRKFLMNMDRKRILDFLVSTFDDFLLARQRESESKLAEARNRLEQARQQERFVKRLAADLKSPLVEAEETLGAIISGDYGELEARQSEVISELRAGLQSNVKMLERLVEEYRREGAVGSSSAG